MERQDSGDKAKYKVIGTRPIRHDGEDKVTGRAQYGADVMFHDQLYGHVLRSPHAHARILKVDTSKALAMPGVLAAVTCADLPQGEISPGKKLARDRVLASDKALFRGHPIAAVAAVDRWTAEEAAKAIEVKYELLPAVMDVMEAMKEDAPLVQEGNTTATLGEQEAKPSNVVNHTQHKRGDVDEGFAKAELVIHIGTARNAWSDVADLVLPGYTYAEKRGSFTNKAKRVQRIHAGIRPPRMAREQIAILQELLAALGKAQHFGSAPAVFDALANEQGAFKGLSWDALGAHGAVLPGA